MTSPSSIEEFAPQTRKLITQGGKKLLPELPRVLHTYNNRKKERKRNPSNGKIGGTEDI